MFLHLPLSSRAPPGPPLQQRGRGRLHDLPDRHQGRRLSSSFCHPFATRGASCVKRTAKQRAFMSGQQSSGAAASSSKDAAESSDLLEENWRSVEDHAQRRKIQNRNAQRRFREKNKKEREENAKIAEHQDAAGSAYTAPDPSDLRANANPSGLPWGSLSLQHVVETGKESQKRSLQASRESSVAPGLGRGGGSSSSTQGLFSANVGLRLYERWPQRPTPWNVYGWSSQR